MSSKILRIKIRRDEYSRWEEINPVLLLAEQGYETDTRKMKIGNGVDKYLDLPYFGETLETIDGFLVTPKIKLETKTKFLIRELLTQADANEYFLDNLISQEEQIKEIVEGGLDNNYVETTGDEMTGTLRMVEEDGYRYNLSERTTLPVQDQPVGYTTITRSGQLCFESYYAKQDEAYVIDVKDNGIPNPLNALTISSTNVVVGRDLSVLGQLFVSGVNILDTINDTVDLGITRNLQLKYDKVGGPITGPLIVFPNGIGAQAKFTVDINGVWSYVEPTHPNHVATKGYVDREKMPLNLSELRPLASYTSFMD